MLNGLYDTHMHTPLCRHAIGEPTEYAQTAFDRGLAGIIFTCHNPVANWGAGSRMQLEELERYVEIVLAAADEWRGRLDVCLGLESDFAPGMESYLEQLHQRAPFRYILGSVHPALPQYKERFYTGNDLEFQSLYFEHLALAAESGLFSCISHPDLVKNEFPETWNVLSILPVIERALDRIAKTGIAMELNTSGINKKVPEMNPGPVILHEISLRGIPVVIGSDSHRPERVGASFREASSILHQAGFASSSVVLDGTLHRFPLEASAAIG
jgi:histidinol-phosphatase (PHP family)